MHHSVIAPVLQVLFFVAFGLVAVITAVRRRDESRMRTLSLRAEADKLKFDDFNPGPNKDFVMGWSFLDCFSQGENRYVFNMLEGTYHEEKMFIFDYHYRTGSGKNEEDHYSTVFMLVVKECFPKITIGPENLLLRMARTFDSEDIKFESAEFSKTFRVRCVDKKFAYDVCNPQMMDFLLANRDLHIEIQGPVISLVFAPQLPVKQFEFNLQRLAQIRSLLPQYLFTNT